jgi:hypothetical protein
MEKTAAIFLGLLCMALARGLAPADPVNLYITGQEPAHAAAKPEPHVVEGRVTIKLDSRDLTIGQYNKIPLDLHGYPVERITGDFGPTAEMEYPPDPDTGVLSLKRDNVGGTYVDVLPTRMGKFPLRLLVSFADGGLDSATAEVNVDRIPAETPRQFLLTYPVGRMDFTKRAGTLRLDLSPQYSKSILIPAASYGVHSPVPLYPIPASVRDDIAVTVITRKNREPSVVYDVSTGEVRAVRLGQALVKATLRGKSAYACVDVMQDVREFNQRSNCEDFRPPDLTGPIDEPMEIPKPVVPLPQ